MTQKQITALTMLTAAMFLLMAGCSKALKVEPTSFTFEGLSWDVISAEFQNKFGCSAGASTYRIVEPSSSETLLVLEFGTLSDLGLNPPRSLLNSLSKVVLKDTLQKPLCYEAAKQITGPNQKFGIIVAYVFSVPKGMTSLEIVLPDNQIILITTK